MFWQRFQRLANWMMAPISWRERTADRYLSAAAFVLGALLLRLSLDGVMGTTAPFFTFYTAILLSAWFGGFGPALCATIVSVGVVAFVWIFPVQEPGMTVGKDYVRMTLFFINGALVSLIIEALRWALRRQEDARQWFEVTLSSIGDAVIATDKDNRVSFINAAGERLTGWPRPEAMGQPLEEVFRIEEEKSGQRLGNVAARVQRRDEPAALDLPVVLVARDGTRRTVADRIAPIRGVSGTIGGVVLVFNDVSVAREAQRALEESETRFKEMADSAPVLIWLADTGSDRVYFNRPWLEFTGRTATQEYGSGWAGQVHPDDLARCLEVYELAFQARRKFSMEYRLRRTDGEYRWLLDTGRPRETLDGTFLGFIGSCIDITEMKESRVALEQKVQERTASLQETMGEMEAFSYTVSHDLRAPLRAMQGYADALQVDYGNELAPRALEYVERIANAAERLDRLTQDVLTYSRVSRPMAQPDRIDLDRLAQDLIQQYPDFQQGPADIRVERPLLPVLGNESALSQCLANLVGNALKFVPKGAAPRLRIWTELAHRRVRLNIEDNGIGISAADKERIFTMFERVHTTKEYQGTGIGLAIVKKAVERMGGSVGVEPGREGGSRFWIVLDAPEPEGKTK